MYLMQATRVSARGEPITEWCRQHPKPNIEGPQVPQALPSPLSIVRHHCRSYGDSRGLGTHSSDHLSKLTHGLHVKWLQPTAGAAWAGLGSIILYPVLLCQLGERCCLCQWTK